MFEAVSLLEIHKIPCDTILEMPLRITVFSARWVTWAHILLKHVYISKILQKWNSIFCLSFWMFASWHALDELKKYASTWKSSTWSGCIKSFKATESRVRLMEYFLLNHYEWWNLFMIFDWSCKKIACIITLSNV